MKKTKRTKKKDIIARFKSGDNINDEEWCLLIEALDKEAREYDYRPPRDDYRYPYQAYQNLNSGGT